MVVSATRCFCVILAIRNLEVRPGAPDWTAEACRLCLQFKRRGVMRNSLDFPAAFLEVR